MMDRSAGEPLERLVGRARYEPRPHNRPPEKLAPLRRLLAVLGHPERVPRVVHVAGTNGKGSVATLVARLLSEPGLGRATDSLGFPGSGRAVGLYTSPHLTDLRERIRIRGAPIAPDALETAAGLVFTAVDSLPESTLPAPLGYFDLLTAIAWCAFCEAGLEWVVLETGLGGLADATNVGPKELALLTPIGHDHQAVLGADLRTIATQKLGIVSPGGTVVLASQPAALGAFMRERLQAIGCRIHEVGDPVVRETEEHLEELEIAWGFALGVRVQPPAHKMTDTRRAAMAMALTAFDVLQGPPAAVGGLSEARRRAEVVTTAPLHGRQQWIDSAAVRGNPNARLAPLVLDGAHNAEALAALAAQLERWEVREAVFLVGLLADKLVPALEDDLRRLLSRSGQVIGICLPFPRAPEPHHLQEWLSKCVPSPNPHQLSILPLAEALTKAAEWPGPAVAVGSLWMVGEIMKHLELAPDDDPMAAWGA